MISALSGVRYPITATALRPESHRANSSGLSIVANAQRCSISASSCGCEMECSKQKRRKQIAAQTCLAALEIVRIVSRMGIPRPDNGRFLRHRFSPKPKVIATQNSLPKRNHVAKEAVSAALQTMTRRQSERICKPNDAPTTKPRPCVKTMLYAPSLRFRSPSP